MSARAKYVLGFVFNEDESTVLLLRKRRPEWQRGKLNGIGGHIEHGELPGEAMTREAIEEAGLEASWTLFAHLSNEGWEMWCYRAVDQPGAWRGRVNDVGEYFEPSFVSDVTAARVQTIPNLRWLVPMALSSSCHDWPYRIRECGAVTLSMSAEEAP